MHLHTRRGSFGALLLAVSLSSVNPQKVADLAAYLNMSVRKFQRRCNAHGIVAKQALDFVRCANVVANDYESWSLRSLFPDLDPRTANRLCKTARFSDSRPKSVEDFVASQRLITEPRLRREILLELKELGERNHS